MKRIVLVLFIILACQGVMAQNKRLSLSSYYFGRNNKVLVYDDTVFVGCNKGVFAYNFKAKDGEKERWIIYGFNDYEIISFAKSGSKMLAVRRTFQNTPNMYQPEEKQTLLLSGDEGQTSVDITPDDVFEGKGIGDMSIRQMPDSPDHILLVYPSSMSRMKMLESRDFGQNWEQTEQRDPFGGLFAVDPKNSSHIVVYGMDPLADCICPYIFETNDNFHTLTNIAFTMDETDRGIGFRFRSVAISPQDNRILLAATSCGIAKSADGGITWNHIIYEESSAYSSTGFTSIAFDKDHPQTAFACYNRYDQGYAFMDLYRSENAGESWDKVYTSYSLSGTVTEMEMHDNQLFFFTPKEDILILDLAMFPTSITSASGDSHVRSKVYDLSGRELSTIPQHDIYIKDGKKIVSQSHND